MRYFLFCLGMFALTPLWAANINESVAAISYNPSRLGAYEYLKVVRRAEFMGGINTTTGTDDDTAEVNFKSKGTISLGADLGNCDNPASDSCQVEHKVQKIKPMPSRTNCANHSDLCEVSSDSATTLTTGTNTVIQKVGNYANTSNLSWIGTDAIASTSFPSYQGVTEVDIKGGTLTVGDSNTGGAFVGKILSVATLTTANGGNFYGAVEVPTTGSFKVGNTLMPTTKCNSITWVERIDMYGAKAKILACK